MYRITTRSGIVTTLAAGALIAGLTLTGCSSSAQSTSRASAPTTSSPAAVVLTPRLSSADNFRDIAGDGTGYATTNGKHVKLGVIYRSNALALSPEDVATLSTLGITQIYDLRTKDEIAAKPDVAVPGATWTHFDIIGQNAPGTTTFATPADAITMMETIYRQFVSSPSSRAAIAQTLTALATADGAQVIHCTAGKDRTGWITALALSIAGVSRDTINQNYLLTNEYSKASIDATLAGVRAKNGEAAAAAYAPLMGVQQSFLDASYEQMTEDYGTLDSYLRQGLGLSSETIATLKAKLVE